MTFYQNSEIVAFIDKLAETGSNYRMDEMEALYTDDLGFLVLTPEGNVGAERRLQNSCQSMRKSSAPI